ncbi:putative 3-oxoacyl-[acyl-carrier-protein] reductase [Medicago truncatula]|uniref:Enoyl-(Acyl carrier) reductase n=1 Tax=Medicago truncatula TaxID=3880 RepID=A0A072UMG3_MEDTR|nr:NADPH-dependent pterin aldehyde reductase [Medicago truncatula]KEH30263.1 enoyl-(acyl carrier) reductase [Medicago truncatula]RHN61109.1 putative 3-oxoacyl-[acyl-carrier-protein] reductase [Medicago truncatula]
MVGSGSEKGRGKGIEMGVGIGRSDGNQTVMITGVSKGLGRALAIELANRGHTIIGCSRDHDNKLDFLQSQLPSTNHHLFISVDVRCNYNVEEMAHIVMEKKGGPPDIIVNGAGVINKNSKMWEVPSEEFDSVMDTNLKGTANVLRHFIPLMIAKNKNEMGGIIVNMSSGWGRSGAALVAPYCASKWAIEGLTKSVAEELPKGMAVVALNPGVINTDMLASCYGASSSLYQSPESWASEAATKILNLTPADNGASLSI